MAKSKKFLTCDGNQAAANISYMFTEVAAIYPDLSGRVGGSYLPPLQGSGVLLSGVGGS